MEHRFTRRAVIAGGASLLTLGPALAWPTHPNPLVSIALEKTWRMGAQYVGHRVGNGSCWDFVAEVYTKLGYPFDGYVWGRKTGDLYHGTVMQMWNARWEKPGGGGYFETTDQHTLIVATVQGKGVLNVLQQNWNGSDRVTYDQMDFSWKLVRGSVELYEPNV